MMQQRVDRRELEEFRTTYARTEPVNGQRFFLTDNGSTDLDRAFDRALIGFSEAGIG